MRKVIRFYRPSDPPSERNERTGSEILANLKKPAEDYGPSPPLRDMPICAIMPSAS